nr:MAG TPA: hypothetical protein [Caudoviricetes sp.]
MCYSINYIAIIFYNIVISNSFLKGFCNNI